MALEFRLVHGVNEAHKMRTGLIKKLLLIFTANFDDDNLCIILSLKSC